LREKMCAVIYSAMKNVFGLELLSLAF